MKKPSLDRSPFLRRAAIVAISIHASGCAARDGSTCSVNIMYQVLPSDDKAIEKLFEKRHGVHDLIVSRRGQEVSIQFGTDPAPSEAMIRELLDLGESLGYQGRLSYRGNFFDRSRRGTNRLTIWVEFGSLPEDDIVMEKWLASLAGISAPLVSRSGKVVSFAFDLANPPPPTIQADVLKKCAEAGYKDQAGYIWAFGRYDREQTAGP